MKTVELFDVEIAAATMAEAARCIDAWVQAPRSGCRYVVTPNADHIVKLQSDAEFRQAYTDASLVLADGWPVVTASRLLGRALPEVVPGSSLVPYLFRSTRLPRLDVFILGAAPGVAQQAAENIQRSWPQVNVCGVYSPPWGFEKSETGNLRAIAEINGSGASVLLLALGSPKQEVWISKHASELNVKVALCVGAAVDFLAGTKKRAPEYVRRMKLEWLHRLGSEPKRLWKRYATDAVIFPVLVLKEAYKVRTQPKP